MNRIPGIQYPPYLEESNPEHAAIKNVFDNLFYLRGKVSDILNAPAPSQNVTQQQVTNQINQAVTAFSILNKTVFSGTHSQRLSTPPTAGSVFVETDRFSIYAATIISNVLAWTWAGGNMVAPLASKPADLNASNDTGFIFTSNNALNQTQYVWTGTIWVTSGGYLQEIDDAVTAAITTVEVNTHGTSGVAAQGFGAGKVTQLQDSGGVKQTALYETVEWSNAGTTSSLRRWWLRVAGVLTDLLDLDSAGLLTTIGKYSWKAGTAFTGTLNHANTGNRTYTLADADGNMTYETAVLTNDNFLFGGGGALVKDAGFGSPLPVANGGTAVTYNRIADTRSLTNQAADIAPTNFNNVVAPGLYRVSYSLEDTTSDVTAGAVTASIAFQADATGTTTLTTAAQVLTGAGVTQGSFFAQLVSGSIAFSTSHTGLFGTAKYSLYLVLERLA